jgi:hypothetical protein
MTLDDQPESRERSESEQLQSEESRCVADPTAREETCPIGTGQLSITIKLYTIDISIKRAALSRARLPPANGTVLKIDMNQ